MTLKQRFSVISGLNTCMCTGMLVMLLCVFYYHFQPHICVEAARKCEEKARNKLNCEADMRCALSSTTLRIKMLVSKKQLHP